MSEQPAAAEPDPPGSEPNVSADWQALEGIDPDTAEFPAESRLGEQRMLVLRVGEGFRGIERSCPHQQRSLHDAFLQAGDTMLRCRWHNYVFRLRDGKGVNCPGYKLKVFEVRRDNNVLLARAVP